VITGLQQYRIARAKISQLEEKSFVVFALTFSPREREKNQREIQLGTQEKGIRHSLGAEYGKSTVMARTIAFSAWNLPVRHILYDG